MKAQTLIFRITGVVFCTLTLLSCQKEAVQTEEIGNENVPTETVTPPSSGETVQFSAGIDTKTYIGAAEADGSYWPRWHATDHVIVNGVQSSDLTLTGSGHGAEFTVDDISGPYCAVTPASAYSSYSAGNNTVSILVRGTGNPQVYTTTGSGAYASYDRDCGIFAAYSVDNTMSFKPVMCWYKISFEGSADSDNIKSVYIRQAGENQNIAGLWTVSFPGGVPTMTPTTLSAIIALNCGNEGVSQSKPLMIGVPAYDYDDGLIITVKDVNGHFISKTIPAEETALAAKAGTIITKTLAFSPKSGTINNAADWNAFAAAVNSANDWDLYRWVGNGTVKVKSFTADRQLFQIQGRDGKFKFNVDGTNGNATGDGPAVITQTGGAKAGYALFRNIHGYVSSLILDGELSNSGARAGLVDTLYAGANISHVTNRMNITSTTNDGGVRSGLVRIALGGSLTDCHNSGNITLTVDCSSSNRNCEIGGLIGQTNYITGSPCGNVVLTDCTNSGTLTVTPTYSGTTYGIEYAGMGGIIAWVRSNSQTITLNNCDNSGALIWNKPDASRAKKQTSVGGIIGIGAPVNASTMLTPASNNGMLITLKDCDNSGTITCKALSNSASGESRQKVYIGGLAGSLMGQEDTPVVVNNCKSLGSLIPYDITSDDPYNDATASQRAAFCAVLGGISGWSGYINVSNGTTVGSSCTIGSINRQVVAVAGAFGFAVRKFSITDSYIFCKGYFNRDTGYKSNRAVVAVVPVKYNSTAMETIPDIAGSTLTNCHLGGSLVTNTSTFSYETTTCLSSNATLFNSSSKTEPNLVCGQGYSTVGTDVTVTDYTYWNGN